MRRLSPALLLIASLAGSGCALRPIWNPPNTGETTADASAPDARASNDAGPVQYADAASFDVGLNPGGDSGVNDSCDPALSREAGVVPDGGCRVDASPDVGADGAADAPADDSSASDAGDSSASDAGEPDASDAVAPTDGEVVEAGSGGEGGA